MRRTLIATFALASLLGGASAAGAQRITSPIEYIEPKQSVGFFGGYLVTDPSIAFDSTSQVSLGVRSAPIVGARYQLRFGGPISGEAALAFSPTRRDVLVASTDPGNPAPRPSGSTADAAVLMGDVGIVFQLTGPRTWHRLAPYLAVNGGLVADLAGTSAAEEDIPEAARFEFGPSFAVGGGIGTDWFPTQRLSIRLEARDRLWRLEVPEGLRPGSPREISEWTNNASFTLGAALHF
ncbi:MAG: hypothetical protein M3P24_02185 [Gemmatimonadota bacterium]|nr:hypothetical protein [Gemmatimonadota bacterium]